MTTYKGSNGQIDLEDDTLVLRREGIGVRLTFGKDVPVRRIPVQAVSGVRFTDAGRLNNRGWLQLLLGGVDKPEHSGGTKASEDPDAVTFDFGDRKRFADLRDRLNAAIDASRAAGIDPAEQSFDAGVSPAARRAASAEASKAKLEEAKAQVEDLKELRRQRQVDSRRPDVDEAAAKMNWKLGGKRELAKLPEHLHDDETVEFIAQGTYRDKQGIVVLTTTRVLFVFHGLVGQFVEDFPINRISSVSSSGGFGSGELKIHASGNDALIKGVVKQDLKPLTDAIRRRLAVGDARPAPAAAPAPTSDVLDQIKRLGELREAGVLDQEEFEAKKAELLHRL